MEFRRRGYPANQGRSYGKLEQAARQWREKLCPGLPLTQALPVLDVFEHLDHFHLQVGRKRVWLDWAVEHLPVGFEGGTRYDEESNMIVVALSPDTYAGLEVDRPRDRFSGCHEIGHGVLHRSELVEWGQMRHSDLVLHRKSGGDLPVYRDVEWQADVFAGELLVPSAGLDELAAEFMQIETLAEVYLVSSAAAEQRLKQHTERCRKRDEPWW